MPKEKWSSVKETAEHLGVKQDTLYKWIPIKTQRIQRSVTIPILCPVDNVSFPALESPHEDSIINKPSAVNNKNIFFIIMYNLKNSMLCFRC